MKKLTHLLAFFAMLYSATPFYGQSTISVRAPAYYQSIVSSQPSELFVQPYTTGCYLITAAELAALTGSNITSFGIHLFIGNVNAVASGNISVYLQNTGDVNYAKGNSFPSCITGMSNVYTGATTIPAITATTDVTCPLATPFTYTGGGLYVAFSWTAGVSSNISLYSFGTAATSFGVINGQSSPTSALNTMSTTAYRPTFVFGLTNTATNEVGVDAIIAPGKVAEALHAAQVVQANIRNISINTLNNVQVSLAVSGATSFSDSQVIPSLAPGAVTTVSFAAYTPTALGSNNIVVSIPPDQNPANNQRTWTQSVTCSQAGNGPPGGNYYEPVAFQGILAGKFNFSAAATMNTVRLAISSTGINDVVHGVLLDHSGAVIARTNTLTVITGMPYSFQSFTFATTQTLQANTDYYIGMGLPNTNLSTMGCVRITDPAPGVNFGILPLAGGTFTLARPAYYGIEPVLNGTINVSPSASVICQGETIVLTPAGAYTYNWSTPAGSNLLSLANGSLVVTPVSDAAYIVTGTDVAGCTGQAYKALKVAVCNGIAETGAHHEAGLYPNPAVNGKTSIHGLQGTNTIVVFNLLGQAVLNTTSNEETVNIDMTSLPAGNYLVKITDANNHSKIIKLIYGE